MTASDESEANLLAYHESATSKTLMVDAIQIPKAGMNLAKGSTDLQRFKGCCNEQITPRCVCLKSSASSDYLTRLPVNADNVTTTNITNNTGSVPNSQESLNLLEIILIVALLGLCIITTLIIISCLFSLLVIRLEKRANVCRQCMETLRKSREVDPYGQVHHDEDQISEADSSMEQ